jgi:hypothetical protein
MLLKRVHGEIGDVCADKADSCRENAKLVSQMGDTPFLMPKSNASSWAMGSYAWNAPKHGLGVTTAFALLFLGFTLLDLVSAGVSGMAKVAGWEIFLTGLIAWYVAMAVETNTNFARKSLPT